MFLKYFTQDIHMQALYCRFNVFICQNSDFINYYFYLCLFMCMHCTDMKLLQQRALLEQKQKKKRQEPLMVQATADGRSRTRRTKQCEEQAPLVESYLSNTSTTYNG